MKNRNTSLDVICRNANRSRFIRLAHKKKKQLCSPFYISSKTNAGLDRFTAFLFLTSLACLTLGYPHLRLPTLLPAPVQQRRSSRLPRLSHSHLHRLDRRHGATRLSPSFLEVQWRLSRCENSRTVPPLSDNAAGPAARPPAPT